MLSADLLHGGSNEVATSSLIPSAGGGGSDGTGGGVGGNGGPGISGTNGIKAGSGCAVAGNGAGATGSLLFVLACLGLALRRRRA